MLKSKVILLSGVCALFLFTGCQNIQGPEVPESRLTAGKVQQSVSKGMYSTDVVKALGSPNILTKDKTGKTTWVYDRVSTYHSKTGGGLNFARMNGNDFVITGGILAGTAAALSNSSPSNFLISAAALGLFTLLGTEGNYEHKTEQKTITIILDFNENDQLENFSYMSSSF